MKMDRRKVSIRAAAGAILFQKIILKIFPLKIIPVNKARPDVFLDLASTFGSQEAEAIYVYNIYFYIEH